LVFWKIPWRKQEKQGEIKMQRRTLLVGATALPFAMPALAQDNFPSRAVSMVVAFPPGGQADVVGRPAAATLERIWRVPVPITNRASMAARPPIRPIC
jgi:tripartite-type tricarboxylate transporter receptor subunit TctC